MAPRFSRRTTLRAGVGGAILLGFGGVLLKLQLGYDVAPQIAAQLRVFSPKEMVIIEAVVARMVRSEDASLPDPHSLSPGLFVDRLAQGMDDATRSDLRKLLHVVEHVLPASLGKTTRFSRLSGGEQDEVLTAMMNHQVGLLRGAFEGLKSLSVMVYFSSPMTWEMLGYDGPRVGRPADGWWPRRKTL